MRLFRYSGYPDWDFWPSNPGAAVIGNFDGLHLGHRALIERLKTEDISRKIVISFYPHPQVVLGRAASIPVITSLRQKCRIFNEWNIEELHLFHFTKHVSEIEYQKFLSEIIFKNLNVRSLVLGPDARIGKGGFGTVDKIGDEFKRLGGRVSVASVLVDSSGVKISSRRVRDSISTGNIQIANELLGRNFAIEGYVVKGDGRGKGIGIPTINLLPNKQVVPQNGVYVTRTKIEESYLESVTNIGIRPTFGGKNISIETHILKDISNKALVGKRIEVEFIKRLRDEKKFENAKALVSQIQKDIKDAKAVFDSKI